MSISIPRPALYAVSEVEQTRPAAPISCIPTARLLSINSRHASRKTLPILGSPIATADFFLSASSSSAPEAKLAPATPSRPVGPPTIKTGFPTPLARAFIKFFFFRIPTVIALTNGFPS